MEQSVVDQTRENFREFTRPMQVVVHDPHPLDFHPDIHCVDCNWVSESLESHDCNSLFEIDDSYFRKIAIDCLNVEAFLHFLPALFKQSFGREGKELSETLAWIFGVDVDDWDSDQTISQQMAPRLNRKQKACVLQFLYDIQKFHVLSPYSANHLSNAISFWSMQPDESDHST